MAAFKPPRVDLSRYKSVQTRPGQQPDLAFAVAISGGGHRAANFAAGVLLAIEDIAISGHQNLNLLKEVDYFSTVSGGGFPVAAYLSTRLDQPENRKSYKYSKALMDNDKRFLHNLRKDYQITLLEATITPKCYGYKDAGDLLEQKFDAFLLGAKYRDREHSLALQDIFRLRGDPQQVELPYWFCNATIYENGTRFVFTPGMLEEYNVEKCIHRLEQMDISGNPGRMPLAVGLKTSASFPVLIPATTLTCNQTKDPLNPYLHLIDGGLVDNQGIYTAFEVLRQDPATRKVLIIIDAYKGVSQPHSRWRASPSGPEMAGRIMKIALDSAHNRLKETITAQQQLTQAQSDAVDIEVILLSFSALKPETVAKMDDLEAEVEQIRKAKFKGFMRRIQREIKNMVDQKNQGGTVADDISGLALYQDVYAVGTTLFITKPQQELLFQAGREVVEQQRDSLIKALVPEKGVK